MDKLNPFEIILICWTEVFRNRSLLLRAGFAGAEIKAEIPFEIRREHLKSFHPHIFQITELNFFDKW